MAAILSRPQWVWTHRGHKMLLFYRRPFGRIFLDENGNILITVVRFCVSNKQYVRIGFDNGLLPIRQKALSRQIMTKLNEAYMGHAASVSLKTYVNLSLTIHFFTLCHIAIKRKLKPIGQFENIEDVMYIVISLDNGPKHIQRQYIIKCRFIINETHSNRSSITCQNQQISIFFASGT